MRLGIFVGLCVGSVTTIVSMVASPHGQAETGASLSVLTASTASAPTLDFVMWSQTPAGSALTPIVTPDGKQAFVSAEEVFETMIQTHFAGGAVGDGSGLKSRFSVGNVIGHLDSITTVENGFFLGPQDCQKQLEVQSNAVIRLLDQRESSLMFSGRGNLQCAFIAGSLSLLSSINARVVPGSGTGFFVGMEGSVVTTFHTDLVTGQVSEVVTFRLIPPN